jgi:hypothetical protein
MSYNIDYGKSRVSNINDLKAFRDIGAVVPYIWCCVLAVAAIPQACGNFRRQLGGE